MKRVTTALVCTVFFGCGGASRSIVAPELPTDTSAPYFTWHGPATEAQQAYADMAWERIAVCVGVDKGRLRNFPIYLLDALQGLATDPWPLYGIEDNGKEVAACGTATPIQIKVVNIPECFEGGLPSEIMHVALWLNHESSEHNNPKFTSCRWW